MHMTASEPTQAAKIPADPARRDVNDVRNCQLMRPKPWYIKSPNSTTNMIRPSDVQKIPSAPKSLS